MSIGEIVLFLVQDPIISIYSNVKTSGKINNCWELFMMPLTRMLAKQG